jgi:hypothetical protein
MELFQEKVLNRIPFFASHYEGHSGAAAMERPHEAERPGRLEQAGAHGGNGHGR